MRNNKYINLDEETLKQLKEIKKDENFSLIKHSSYMYNCISYSIDIDSVFIWPSVSGLVSVSNPRRSLFWPRNLLRNASLENFKKFYKLFAFEETDNPEYELGYRKIAVYSKNEEVTHASVIQSHNICLSKVGLGPVISHTFGFDNENGFTKEYGKVTFFSQRELLYGKDFTLEMIKRYS